MKRIVFILSVLSVFLSCEKESHLPLDKEKEYIPFSITPRLDVETKAIDGSYFGTGSYNLGLWLGSRDNSGVFVPQVKGYDNIKAGAVSTAGGSSSEFRIDWTYTLGGNSYKKIYIEKGKEVEVYSYHPWVSNVADLTSVPFVSGQNDWMWAAPVKLTQAQTLGDAVVAQIQYSHAMTCVDVQISCKYEGTVSVTKITLNDTKGRLYARGSMNALDGSLSLDDSDKVGNISITPKAHLNTILQSFSIIMPPVSGLQLKDDSNEGELYLSFEFNEKPGLQKFYLPKSMMKGGVETDIVSFDKGVKYIYQLELDNKVRFAPVEVEENWGSKSIDVIL